MSSEHKDSEAHDSEPAPHPKDFGLFPVPRWLLHDPTKPHHFGLVMNLSFGFATTFCVANLYYSQPLLIQFSKSFDVPYNRVSRIPTLIQAGYATSLVLIAPLGDLVRRRQIILIVMILSTCLTIGLCVTQSLEVFEALSFLIGGVSITAQILLPLAADLAPPERRASAISVVLSGLLLGVLIARVLAGIVAEFTRWQVVYYMAIGVQSFVFLGCYLMLPDYPAKNRGLTYWHILGSMCKLAVTEPILVQACLVNFATSACFSSFWTTLTFLLGEPPYNYSTLEIGLFGLIGICGVSMGPISGRLIDRLIPWHVTVFGVLMLILFQAIQTGAGGINVGAVVVSTLGLDLFRQMLQVSLATAVYSISASARSRLSAILILSLFLGSVMGTSVGTEVFVRYGWRASAILNLAWYGFDLFILMLRGPRVGKYTWFGWEGGFNPRRTTGPGTVGTAPHSPGAGAGNANNTDPEKGTISVPDQRLEEGGSSFDKEKGSRPSTGVPSESLENGSTPDDEKASESTMSTVASSEIMHIEPREK